GAARARRSAGPGPGPGGPRGPARRGGTATRRTPRLRRPGRADPPRPGRPRRSPPGCREGMECGPPAIPLAQPEYPVRRLDAARPRDTHVPGGEARAQERRMKKATLALACGETFEGFACGAAGEAQGEVVFNTSHTGYQEILTDPSYAGQLVTFTVAELGNYGIHHGDEQADTPQVAGFIARRVSRE